MEGWTTSLKRVIPAPSRPTLFDLAAERGVGISQMLAWLDAADSRATDYGSLLDAVINAAGEPVSRRSLVPS